jgi:hypothetical protein
MSSGETGLIASRSTCSLMVYRVSKGLRHSGQFGRATWCRQLKDKDTKKTSSKISSEMVYKDKYFVLDAENMTTGY